MLRCRDTLAALARGWCVARGRLSPAYAVLRNTSRWRHEHVTARVTFEALARRAAADFPTRRVVAAGRAAHHHALAFEVQHRVVPAHAAEQLAERGQPRDASAAGRLCVFDSVPSP